MACKPGEMHEIDKAFYDLTVDQRDRAWRHQEYLEAELAQLNEKLFDAENIIFRFANGKRSDGTYNYSREAAEQQCKAWIDKHTPLLASAVKDD